MFGGIIMEIKDCTRTKDGTPVRIYATDCGGTYPVHGAVWIEKRYFPAWVQENWTRDGKRVLGENHGLDLDLHDWRDDIPWECLKKEIEWVARDQDGIWHGYPGNPQHIELGHMLGHWTNHGKKRDLSGVKMPAGPSDWREAIAQRPEGR
jgi:hypothetical protein